MPQCALISAWFDKLWAFKIGFEVKLPARDVSAAQADTELAYDPNDDHSVDYVSGFAGAG